MTADLVKYLNSWLRSEKKWKDHQSHQFIFEPRRNSVPHSMAVHLTVDSVCTKVLERDMIPVLHWQITVCRLIHAVAVIVRCLSWLSIKLNCQLCSESEVGRRLFSSVLLMYVRYKPPDLIWFQYKMNSLYKVLTLVLVCSASQCVLTWRMMDY